MLNCVERGWVFYGWVVVFRLVGVYMVFGLGVGG